MLKFVCRSAVGPHGIPRLRLNYHKDMIKRLLMFNKLERKFGKYAIKDLTIKLMIVYAVGYAICLVGSQASSSFVSDYLTFNPYLILHGQIWRLITWILIPLQNNFLLYAITIFLFYLPIGRTMESAWGDFKYTLYLLIGLISTIIVGFILYFGYLAYGTLLGADSSVWGGIVGQAIGLSVIPYYFTMSIFFAYAATFPDATVLLMFLIPIQMKWLGIAYAALYGYSIIADIINANWIGVGIIVASLVPFIIFFFLDRSSRFRRNAGRYKPSEVKRRAEFKHNVENARKAQRMTAPGSAHHKCAVCGRTEIDDPNLEFRYCSKCKGAYEYCQDHLFTHVHVDK